ncbi:AAA family ATPase [Actinomadura litoris]|uniref:AAA domain-containing protein n=1 Tax=Actinomadura litoris TaxID=2678616 RepID=A0A7K1KWA4_9ACTN|nr:AAA family ATPase [Actinomadura litoris]MUN36474.1 AAA domain-containing protein [Actinomadura litoris]
MTSRAETTADMAFVAVRLLTDLPPHTPAAGVTYGDLRTRLFDAIPDLASRWREMVGDGWQDVSYTELQWASISLVKAGWLCKRDRKWFPTGLGRAALAEFPDATAFFAEANRAYWYWDRNKARFQTAIGYAEALPEGRWVSIADIASETDITTTALVRVLLGNRPEGWYRLLDTDGSLPREAHLTEPERAEWLALLAEEGVPFPDGRADPQRRMVPSDLQLKVASGDDARARRAWLVRASNVPGGDLITDVWLPEKVCSLSAARLSDLPPGASRQQVFEAVREDYSGTGTKDQERLAGEFHAFLSRMGENDIVVTNDGSEVYLGVIAGDPSFVSSVGNRANLQRAVRWRNADRPIDYDDLPDDFSVLVSNPDAEIVELTSSLPELEKLLGEPVEVVEQPMRLPDATDKLARELLVDREWLQECVEQLRERPQLIFYGPPGTGKTYLARHLARHLTSGRPEGVQLVQFHPAYSYEDFFEGYRPKQAEDGTISFDLVRGPFRRLVSAALAHPGRPYVLIIDEINRGNLAKIFGELYFLLEYRDEPVNLLYAPEEDRGFTLPRNVLIIGTMNTADRSIALIDTAMRRRFWFTELHPDEPPTRDMLAEWLKKEELTDEPARLLAELNRRIEDRDFKIGPSYLMRESAATEVGLARIWRTQILPLLAEHHYGDGTDVEANYGLDALRRRLT